MKPKMSLYLVFAEVSPALIKADEDILNDMIKPMMRSGVMLDKARTYAKENKLDDMWAHQMWIRPESPANPAAVLELAEDLKNQVDSGKLSVDNNDIMYLKKIASHCISSITCFKEGLNNMLEHSSKISDTAVTQYISILSLVDKELMKHIEPIRRAARENGDDVDWTKSPVITITMLTIIKTLEMKGLISGIEDVDVEVCLQTQDEFLADSKDAVEALEKVYQVHEERFKERRKALMGDSSIDPVGLDDYDPKLVN